MPPKAETTNAALTGKLAPWPSIHNVRKTSRKLPNRVLLHAQQKWGKTSFAAMAPSPIFLYTRGEDGLDTLIKSGQLPDTAQFDQAATEWKHVGFALKDLIHEEHDFKTLVIDTINGLERLCIEHLIQKEFDGKMANFDAYGRGNKFVVPEFTNLLVDLDKLREKRNMSIILLAHSQVKTFQNPGGPNYDRWEPVLIKETWALVDRWVDMILFGSFETHVDAKKTDAKGKAHGGTDRIIHTKRTAAFDAGNRYGLPEEIECGESPKEAWANFLAALKGKS